MANPTYKDAGVDIEAGAHFVRDIQPLIDSTARPEVLGGPGGFAGLCAIPAGYRQPLLVSGTDGVGTKLETAFATGRHQTVGVDLVAMAVNDVIVCGAEPLFFLDYLAIGRLDPRIARDVVVGIADGCRQAGCALIGGETAQLPGFYPGTRYDLAGFCVGVVERDEVRDGRTIEVGDAIIGLPSSGLHANGHTLARKVLLERFALDEAPAALGGVTIADELLRPTVIYAPAFAALRAHGVPFRGAAHISGGGLIDNPPRILAKGPAAGHPEALAMAFDTTTWQAPPVFSLIAEAGVQTDEMRRTFNMGIGMIVVCAASHADAAIQVMTDAMAASPATFSPATFSPDDARPRVIGRVVARGDGEPVRFLP